ncbi:hypothetical protein TNCV_2284271 [Trichonephila clavipes]|nr:hypothetical protein TNCV_2284271 [Trichonephila clavipes]
MKNTKKRSEMSPSEQEEDERGPMPTSAIKDLLKKLEDFRAMVLECHPYQADLRLRAKTAWLWLPQSASLTVRCPQRYGLLFSFFIETRGESETYKKDGTNKDYTTNT